MVSFRTSCTDLQGISKRLTKFEKYRLLNYIISLEILQKFNTYNI